MWWLLVPLVGAVIAAVAGSDDEEKEKQEAADRHRTNAQHEREVLAKAKAVEKLNKKNEILATARDQFQALFTKHPHMLARKAPGLIELNVDTLNHFANQQQQAKTLEPLLTDLRGLIPGTKLSPAWQKKEDQADALKKEIAGLKRFKTELLG